MTQMQRRAYVQSRDLFRKMFTWNRNRLVKEHGPTKGERLFRELPVEEAYRLWRTEGPGKLEVN